MKTIGAKIRQSNVALMVLVLLAVLLPLLGGAFMLGHTLFSNDAPLGRLVADCHKLPERFTGCWQDLNSVGYRESSAIPCVTYGLEWLLGPLLLSKSYALLSLIILGLGAWCCFRQFGLAPPACILGGLAAALNSCFFSTSCWGVASHEIAVGLVFFCLAALADLTSPLRWLRVVLGGLTLGMAVIEGADIAAILSVCVAAYLLWQAWVIEGPRVRNISVGVARLGLVVICSGFMAAQFVSELVGTYMQGVVEMEQTPAEHWAWATQWSLPKAETLGLVVPGLFGYRLDSRGGGNYWGATGQDVAWDRFFAEGGQGNRPEGFIRFVGGGNYVGVLVVVLALWAVAQSLRGKQSVYSPVQRKLLWFWTGLGILSLLLAFGRFAPFYRLVYALPYFSNIRNPVKFLYPLNFALVVLFAFGADSLWRQCMRPAGTNGNMRWAGLLRWWAKGDKFEKRFIQTGH